MLRSSHLEEVPVASHPELLIAYGANTKLSRARHTAQGPVRTVVGAARGGAASLASRGSGDVTALAPYWEMPEGGRDAA